MREQNYTPETLYPAEGRCDIAADLEEEQLLAFSAHRAEASGKKTPVKTQQREELVIEICHPAEGRCDVAVNLEEEQCHAYSAHHARHAS